MDSEIIDGIVKEALEAGFSYAGELDASTLTLKEEVRQMCATNTCGKYGKNWACPPGCGELDECRDKIKKFSKGIIVQTVGQLEDSLDFESMVEIQKKHDATFEKFAGALNEKYSLVLSLGAGTCTICEECTYPNAKCRFPDKSLSSMESYGMVVSEVCKDNNMDYYYGDNTMCYTGCYLIEI